MPLRPRRKQWPGRWRGRVGVALVLASAALCGSVPIAAASSSDAQATHAYLIAQYRLVTALLHEAATARGAESAAAGPRKNISSTHNHKLRSVPFPWRQAIEKGRTQPDKIRTVIFDESPRGVSRSLSPGRAKRETRWRAVPHRLRRLPTAKAARTVKRNFRSTAFQKWSGGRLLLRETVKKHFWSTLPQK